MRPSIQQLEYLVAVAKTLNFRRAAEESHVSQPALSTQIQKLEKTLGVKLFERDRRRVLLTTVGAEIVEHANAVLRGVDDLVSSALHGRSDLAGPLRLGIIPTIAPYALPKLLPIVRRQLPDLRLLVREDLTPRLVRELEFGELDLLLVALEADLGKAETLALFDDAFVAATPKSHALAKRKQLEIAELPKDEMLLLDDGHCLADQARELCHNAGLRDFGDFRATSLGTLLHMVSSGIGVTLLPELALPFETKNNRGFTTIPLAAPAPTRSIGLAWRPGASREPAFRQLGELIESAL